MWCSGPRELEALAAIFAIKRAYAYDVVKQVQNNFVQEMSAKLGLEIIGVENPKQEERKSPFENRAAYAYHHALREWVGHVLGGIDQRRADGRQTDKGRNGL